MHNRVVVPRALLRAVFAIHCCILEYISAGNEQIILGTVPHPQYSFSHAQIVPAEGHFHSSWTSYANQVSMVCLVVSFCISIENYLTLLAHYVPIIDSASNKNKWVPGFLIG
jgi:hypothetical protein